MKLLRKSCTGRWPVHFCQKLGVAAGLVLAAAPLALAGPHPASAQARPSTAAQSADDFYRARNDAPLWLAPAAGNAADQLIALLGSAAFDGLDPDRYHVPILQAAVQSARSGKAKDVIRADRALSEAFVLYVGDLAKDPGLGIVYVDPQLRPKPPSARAALLNAAATGPALSDYLRDLGWMSPIYSGLRRALSSHSYADEHERGLIALNLERARALPGGRQRYIIVNAAQQRLYTYEDGKQRDSMRVVVGKPKYPTPMMAAYIRFAALNPYWYVPPDLAAERIAPNTVRRGVGYLKELGYEVLSNWDDHATIIDPKTIDWKAVAAGTKEVLIRQQPGPHNSMGRMKFMFPNEAGVYLHDNPERELFSEASRLYSGGCVRLEDASRLGEWMFGRTLDWESAETEQRVPLAQPVPVYITYLTAIPEGSAIAFSEDVYNRDSPKLARADSGSVQSR